MFNPLAPPAGYSGRHTPLERAGVLAKILPYFRVLLTVLPGLESSVVVPEMAVKLNEDETQLENQDALTPNSWFCVTFGLLTLPVFYHEGLA